jgi:biotin carboxyl carrier protein
MKIYLAESAGVKSRVEVEEGADGLYRVRVGEETFDVDFQEIGADSYSLIVGHQSCQVAIEPGKNDHLAVVVDGQRQDVTIHDPRKPSPAYGSVSRARGDHLITSPMAGNIWKVLKQEGETVAAGEVLIIIEAMKMENEIRSPIDGLLASMLVKEGDAVTAGTSLCSVAVVKG